MGPLTTPTNLSRILSDAAERRGDHLAIVDRDTSSSWSEADRRAGQMAAALADVGIGRGDRVGVHFRKSTDAYLAMHAVVRLGAIAVPLDPTASPTYLAQVCRLSDCRVVLTHDPCAPSAHRLGAEADLRLIIGIGASDDAGPGTGYIEGDAIETFEPVPPAATNADDPSYLITTSGSTGTPKSMCHTHGSALGHVQFMLDGFDFHPDDRFGDIAPNHFDISTPALWVASTLAATVVVVPEPHQMLPASAAQLAEEERLTVWYSVPYLLVQLYNRGNIEEHPSQG
ncbi:MAG: AMP-binding protein [Actinomycetota bacterium]